MAVRGRIEEEKGDFGRDRCAIGAGMVAWREKEEGDLEREFVEEGVGFENRR